MRAVAGRAKVLRSSPTPAERRLWRVLYSLRTGGVHLRKQAPIGPYIADIACHHPKLVIEVDGDTHGSAVGVSRDQRRDAFLRSQGYRVLHFTNHEVMGNSEDVMMTIVAAVEIARVEATPSPTLPTRGRVPGRATGKAASSQQSQPNTLPLVGRVGEGES